MELPHNGASCDISSNIFFLFFQSSNFWASMPPSSILSLLYCWVKKNIFPSHTDKNKIPNGKIYCQIKLFEEERKEEIFHVRLVQKFEMKFSRFPSYSSLASESSSVSFLLFHFLVKRVDIGTISCDVRKFIIIYWPFGTNGREWGNNFFTCAP